MRTERSLPTLLTAFLCACTASDNHVQSAPKLSEAELTAQIERGRALLDAGQPLEAEAVFKAAAAADHESLRTRMWVLRAWMDQGRSNDTLDALDELDRAGQKGLEMTYLYGMAFARRAEGYLADGVADSSVQNNFMDATSFLAQVTKADAALYRDAFLPLARSAWYVRDFETARWAADRAVETQADPTSWLERGRIAMAQFALAREEDPEGAPAAGFLADGVDSFRRVLEGAGAPRDEPESQRLAEAATQLGHALLWQEKTPDATEAYAMAIAWDPQGFDYFQTAESLRTAPKDLEDERPSGFRAALEEARTRFETAAAPGDPRAGTLLWWLGWARFGAADWTGAEGAFQAALAVAPMFTNSWFYIGLAREYRKDSEGALAAMHAGWDADPSSMITTVASNGGALRAFEGLLAWCAAQEPARNLDAAFLAEMLAEAMPNEVRHWNNLGLFLRDEGERLEIEAYENETPEPDAALLADLYGRAFGAYQRALELSPDDPQIINDTALMLHYHLDGDLATAEATYRRALVLLEARLAASALSADDRARFEQSKSDVVVNLKLLLGPAAEAKEAATEESPSGENTGDTATQETAAATSGGGR